MFRNYTLAGTLAVLCTGVAVGAQTPATGAGQQPTPSTPATASEQAEPQARPQTGTTTMVGCVYQEKDVPGRTPNVAERAGILEDYILADAKPASSQSGTSATPGATGTSGAAGTMYKLEHADDDKLRELVGKRVEVTGRIDAERGDSSRPAGTSGTAAGTAAPERDKSLGPDQIELPEFEVTSIKAIEGTCPAAPASNR